MANQPFHQYDDEGPEGAAYSHWPKDEENDDYDGGFCLNYNKNNKDNDDDDRYNDDEGTVYSHWPDLIASICRRHAGSVSRSHQHHLKIILRTRSYWGMKQL